MLLDELEIRKNTLEKIIARAENFIQTKSSLEKYSLRVENKNTSAYYYLRDGSDDRKGKLLAPGDIQMARDVAQFCYNEKIIVDAKKELSMIEKMIQNEKKNSLVAIYDSMSEGRKKLIRPFAMSNDEFAKLWQSQAYEGKPFVDGEQQIFTRRGERVRSKSEKIIADTLYARKIPYRYEFPIRLDSYGTVFPDFTVLNIRKRKIYILEHFGLLDDEVYFSAAIKKVESYQKSGIYPGDNLLITYETRKKTLDTRLMDGLIDKFLV